MKMHKISKGLQYSDPMGEIKNQKLQEEKAEQGYESEKVQVDVAKKSIEDMATVATNPATLYDLVAGILTTPASIKEYPQVKNQPQGWKDLVIRKIIENQHATAETLYMCWKLRIKPQIHANFGKEIEMVDKISAHTNLPPTIIEELSEFLLQNKDMAQDYRLIIGSVSSYKDNVTPKTLENLYKIYTKTPSLQKQIATHPNAPMDIAINYVLESNNVEKVNEIKNIKAIDYIAKFNKSVNGFNKETIEKLIANKSTSTEVLSIINDIKLHPFDNNLVFSNDQEEKEFFKKLEDEIKTHPNTPFDNNGNLQILNQGYNNEEFRKQSIIDYYSKYINKSPETNKKILDMMEEFKDSDWEISILYDDLKEKISLEQKDVKDAPISALTQVYLPTPDDLKAFWADANFQNKKLYFAVIDENNEENFIVGSQTHKEYLDSHFWNIEENTNSIEEASKKAVEMAQNDPNGIYMSSTEVAHSAPIIHLPTDAHLKAFWEDPKNKTKKIFFVRKDDNDDKFFNIYSQTSWGYNKGNVWHVEGKNFISAEEAKELGQKMASESPDGIYGY